jgi:hypothetical protein
MLTTGINNLKGGCFVLLKIISIRLQGLADNNKSSGQNGGQPYLDSKYVPLRNKSKTLPASSSVLARSVQPTATFREARYGDAATPSL